MVEQGTVNPYAAPGVDVTVGAGDEALDAEHVRTEHINHEASLRAVGALYVIGGALVMIGGVVASFGLFAAEDAASLGVSIGLVVLMLAIAALNIWVGIGLRRLEPRIRKPAIVVSFLSLLNFGIGTIIGIYMLYLLMARKGKTILSDDYARVRELTPHVKVRTSLVTWIALALLIGVIMLIGLGAILER